PLLSLLLFRSLPADPRVLLSFPTRRSSDLVPISSLSSLPIASPSRGRRVETSGDRAASASSDVLFTSQAAAVEPTPVSRDGTVADRKSTRLNSSHVKISYAVFCLKKKKKNY